MRRIIFLFALAFYGLSLNAQVNLEMGLYKSYFFKLGQDLTRPLTECEYSYLKRGTIVEVVEIDPTDMFHPIVKHKKKTGIIHIGAVKDRSPLISFYPQIREKFYNNIKNAKVTQGMNEYEVNLTLGVKPTIENRGSSSVIWSYPNNSISTIYFYKGEVYQIGNNPFYSTVYDIRLVNVQKPENVKDKFSEIESVEVQGEQNMRYIYEDEYIKIDWVPIVDSFKFSIQNKCSHSIKLPWDEMAFIDTKGESKRLLNGDTRKINSDREQPQSVVPRGAKLSGYAVPYPQTPFMPTNLYCCPQELLDRGFNGDGLMIRVLFPVIIQDVVNEYVFEFEFKNAFVIETPKF